mmetsp:Transcript_590/g.1580  ORF Transcript_590/g.1580 Transcript_590/m.1580 type:complete len:277 (-) Transcript_590:678-1508(-)
MKARTSEWSATSSGPTRNAAPAPLGCPSGARTDRNPRCAPAGDTGPSTTPADGLPPQGDVCGCYSCCLDAGCCKALSCARAGCLSRQRWLWMPRDSGDRTTAQWLLPLCALCGNLKLDLGQEPKGHCGLQERAVHSALGAVASGQAGVRWAPCWGLFEALDYRVRGALTTSGGRHGGICGQDRMQGGGGGRRGTGEEDVARGLGRTRQSVRSSATMHSVPTRCGVAPSRRGGDACEPTADERRRGEQGRHRGGQVLPDSGVHRWCCGLGGGHQLTA